jgi:L-lactate dehydrogenase complex protein LldE
VKETGHVRVSLFATCLVDLFFPEVGESAVNVLTRHGCQVDFPLAQTCCGQPGWNSGHPEESYRVARQFLQAFRDSEHIVTPSGSCASMIRVHYPELFHGRPEEAEAKAAASRTYEFSEFLVRVLQVEPDARWEGAVAYHTSCHMSRELKVTQEPFQLLRRVEGLRLCELERPDLCCGFGGTFAAKNPEMSVAMGDDKLEDVRRSGAGTLVACDMGCLMHLGGRLRRRGDRMRVLHLAQLLDEGAADQGGGER